MTINKVVYQRIKESINGKAILVAVSKIKPASDILDLYNLGQIDFGENYVQELVDKYNQLPKDIQWHFIGHLQSNKVKYIAPFIHLIHGVDSLKLLLEINKQALKNNRTIRCLLQVHIAEEETKFGFDTHEILAINWTEINDLKGVEVVGLMGMASFSDDLEQVKNEFRSLNTAFKQVQTQQPSCKILSMGMSGDFEMAIEEGSNMVRIGSLLFGSRQ